MGIEADHRYAVAQRIHEDYNVPLDLLGALMPIQQHYLEKKAALGLWRRGLSTYAMKNELLEIFDTQIKQTKQKIATAPNTETAGKELADLVKILDSFVALETRLLATRQKSKLDLGDRNNKKATSTHELTDRDKADSSPTTGEQLSRLLKAMC